VQSVPDGVKRRGVLFIKATCALALEKLRALRHAVEGVPVILWVEVSSKCGSHAGSLGVRGIPRKLPGERRPKCPRVVVSSERQSGRTSVIPLTQREGQLLTLVTHGAQNEEIAEVLGITEGVVRGNLSRLFQKTGVKDRFELALFGLKNGLTGKLPPRFGVAARKRASAP
jgi:DNA-binding CsgD family transcriptional regulator